MTEVERLDKIEGKIDTLVEAMTNLVRLEEKFAAHEAFHRSTMERFGFRMDDAEGRIETIEKRVPVYEMWAGWANKIAIIVISALVMAVLGLILAG